MRLHVLRHGIAIGRDDPACPAEADRFLTPKGINKTKAAARGLRMLGIRPDLVFTSPFLRAVETAEIVCAALEFPVKKLKRTSALKPDSKPEELFAELSSLKADEVLCVGHAPNVDQVIAHAMGIRSVVTSLKKAGFASLEIETFSPLRSLMVGLYVPKALRLLGESGSAED